MTKKYDFKSEWPNLQKQLVKFSKEALELAKKGEKEIVDLSRKGKKRLDKAGLNLKREGVFKQIGKEYVAAGAPDPHSAAMKKHLTALAQIEKDLKALTKQEKTAPANKKTKRSSVRKSPATKKADSENKD